MRRGRVRWLQRCGCCEVQYGRQCHGGEDTGEDGEEALAAVLGSAFDGFAEGEGAVEGPGYHSIITYAVGDLLVGSDGCDDGANGLQVGERRALGTDEALHDW